MKIIFVTDQLDYGGITTSLLSLINEIQKEGHEIDVLTLDSRNYGVELSENVRLIEPASFIRTCFDTPRKHIKGKHFLRAAVSGLSRLFCKILTNGPVLDFEFLFQPTLGPYDVAIAYRQETNKRRQINGFVRFVTSKCINARIRLGFIHGDYSALGYSSSFYTRLYNKLDAVICVSKGTLHNFKNALPNISTKVEYMYNCQDFERIIQLSNKEEICYPVNAINIVSVSRLTEEKANERALMAVKFCVNAGVNVMYHVIGDGPRLKSLKELTKELEIEKYVVFYGAKKNPYPYIKAADLFVLLSKHEAAPMVFGEAAVLSTPILTTNTSSAKELVEERGFGWICEHNQEDINRSLYNITRNPKVLRSIQENFVKYKFDNFASVQKFHYIIDNME